jgi:hypothetical protein
MHQVWKRRAALGAVALVAGVILALSTLGATAFGGPCTTQICSVPGTEGLLVAGVIVAVLGGVVLAVSVRGMRRSDPTHK